MEEWSREVYTKPNSKTPTNPDMAAGELHVVPLLQILSADLQHDLVVLHAVVLGPEPDLQEVKHQFWLDVLSVKECWFKAQYNMFPG